MNLINAKEPKLFYGWVIVAIAFVSMIFIYGIRHSFSVFLPHFLDEFKWGRGAISIMLSLNILLYGLLAPVAGTLAGRWRLRKFMPVGIIILGLATVGCAFCQKLWHFYVLFGLVMPLGTAFSGSPVLYPTLMNWFTRRRALILGLTQMGAGLSFVYSIFIEFTISQLGWRNTFIVLAAILMISILPLYLFFLYYRPEEKGLKPFGDTNVTPSPNIANGRVPASHSVVSESTLRQVLAAPQLWYLVISHALYWGIGVYLVLAHQVKFIGEMGYSSMFSVSIFALFGISSCTGYLSGFLSDRMGREKTGTFAAFLTISALIILLSIRDASQPWKLYLFTFLFGYGAGVIVPTLYASASEIFHNKHFGFVAGLMHMGVGIGGVIGPWLGGFIYDISGSYKSAFLLCIVSMALACLSLWIAAPRKTLKARAKF